MLYFTGDTHFGHENIIRFCERPYRSAEEMDADLIRRWQATVGDDDDVYHIGDFTLLDYRTFTEYARELTGQIHIVPGSHDTRWLHVWNERITWLDEDTQATSVKNVKSASGHQVLVYPPLVSMLKESYKDLMDEEEAPPTIVLCHYAMRTWDRSHYNSWHLYGHSHGELPSIGMSMDVGVDVWDYKPISLPQVAEKMQILRLLRNQNSRRKTKQSEEYFAPPLIN